MKKLILASVIVLAIIAARQLAANASRTNGSKRTPVAPPRPQGREDRRKESSGATAKPAVAPTPSQDSVWTEPSDGTVTDRTPDTASPTNG